MKGFKVPKRTLTVGEAESIQGEINEKKAMIGATSEFSDARLAPIMPQEVSLNKGKMETRVKELQKILDEDSPRHATSDAERGRIERDMKALEDKFVPYLETVKDLEVIRRDSPEYREARKKAEMRTPGVDALIHRWKELAKRLDPTDPNFSKLDRLRKAA